MPLKKNCNSPENTAGAQCGAAGYGADSFHIYVSHIDILVNFQSAVVIV
jgi:hypothetical protein